MAMHSDFSDQRKSLADRRAAAVAALAAAKADLAAAVLDTPSAVLKIQAAIVAKTAEIDAVDLAKIELDRREEVAKAKAAEAARQRMRKERDQALADAQRLAADVADAVAALGTAYAACDQAERKADGLTQDLGDRPLGGFLRRRTAAALWQAGVLLPREPYMPEPFEHDHADEALRRGLVQG